MENTTPRKISNKKSTKMANSSKPVGTTLIITHKKKGIHSVVKPIIAFITSFLIIVGLILGFHKYGGLLSRIPSVIPIPPPQTRMLSNTPYYDPLDLIDGVGKKSTEIILLDIRSGEEYNKEHIKNAVSLPFYSYINNSIQYTDVQKKIDSMHISKSKRIVVYGPSTSFQFQHTIVDQLKKNGYTAQLLAVGWNELRHFQNIWIPEGLWGKIDINNYIETNN